MKHSIFAVIILALLAPVAVNALEIYHKDNNKVNIYGKIDGLHYLSKDKSERSDTSYAFLGFKGEAQITDRVIGYGQWVYGAQLNHHFFKGSEGSKMRLGFAGLKFTDYSSFDYGYNYGVLHDVESWTDVPVTFSSNTYSFTNNCMSNVTNDVATYRNNNFFGLVQGMDFVLQYQGKNSGSTRYSKEKNGEVWGISSIYDIGEGVSLGAAYASSDRRGVAEPSKKGFFKKINAWTVGTKYNADNIYLAAMYVETHNITPFVGNSYLNGDNTSKTHNFAVTAKYQFDFGLRPAVSYLQSKNKSLHTISVGNHQNIIKNISVGSTYKFNKNISTYINYNINLLNKSIFTKATGTATDNIFAVGMVYQF